MNTYDRAHELAKMLRNSDEYQALLQAKQAVDTDEQTKKMIKDFFDEVIKHSLIFLSSRKQTAGYGMKMAKIYGRYHPA